MLQYSPKIITDSLVMCLDASNNKSYPAADLPVKDRLNLWLDAADDATFSYSSGTTVSQWRDKSGQNNHAPVIGGSPVRSVAINSRKTVSFTSTTSFRCLTGNFTSTATHFLVCRATTSSGTYQRVYNGGADAYIFLGGLSNNIATFWGTGSSWIDVNANSPSTTILNALRIISVINNGSTGTPYYDGNVMSAKTTTNSGAYTGYELNSYSGGNTSQSLVGEVCEIIVFNKQLSTTELKQVHTYLGQKWGISNTDRSIIDLSGFNDNGLLGDGTTANMPVYDYYNKGAFRFDGSNDFIKVGPNSSLQVNNVTIAAFFKTVNNGQSVQFIAGYGDTGIAGYWIGTSGGAIRFSIGGGSGNYLQQSSGVTPNNDQIYYVVGTYDGTNQRVYVNGVLQASATTVTGNISYTGLTDGFLVGQVQGFTAGRYLTGSVYNVSVYSRALSQAEISQNYEALKSKFTDTIVHQGLVLNIDAANPYSYGGAGTTVYDTSNTALSWTATNVTYNSDPIKYFSFNGSNSSLVSSTSTAYDSQTITMECWCYPNSLNQLGFLFEKGAVNSQYSMFFSTTNTFYFRTIGGTINNQDLTFTTTTYLTVSAWNHIVCTYNGSSKVIYVNGTQIASVAASGTLQTGQTNQYIGKYGNAGDNYPFNGRIAESRVYNIALTAAQVLQNYNATRTKYGL
jgi:hypothetical protein